MKNLLKRLKDSIVMDDPDQGLTKQETDIIESAEKEKELQVEVDGVGIIEKSNQIYDSMREHVIDQQQAIPDYLLHDPRVVGYLTREEQEVIFKALAQIGLDPTLHSILDVGSGVGDMYGFLANNLGQPTNYLGIDINPNMISTSQQKYPGVNFTTKDLADMEGEFDYVVSAGTFNLKLADDMYDYVYKSIDKMYSICDKGVAFNLLSDRAEGDRDPGLFYYSPNDVFNHCLQTYGSKVILRHDYQTNEFAILIYKAQHI